MTLQQLMEQRGKLAKIMEERFELFHKQGGEWRDDDQRQAYEAVSSDYNRIMKEIETAKRQKDLDQDLAGQLLHQGGNYRMRGGSGMDNAEAEGRMLASFIQGEARTEADQEACQQFGVRPNAKCLDLALPNTRSAKHFSKEFRAVRPEHRHRLANVERRDLGTGGASGGPTIATTFMRQLEMNLLAHGGVRAFCDLVVSQTGEPLVWPTADDTSNEGALLGEAAGIGSSVDPDFDSQTWGAFKYSSKLIKVSAELLEDSMFDLGSVLGEMIGVRLGRITAKKITNGAGTTENTGYTVAGSSLGVTAAGAAAITYNEVVQLEHSLDPAHRPNATYAMNDSTLLLLRLLKDSDGYPIFQNGANGGMPDRINGREYSLDLNLPAATTGLKSLWFGDFSKVKIRRVNGVRIYRLQELYRANDQEGFIAFVREDSKVLDAGTDPIKYLIQA